jgi:hypothetical protein
MKTKKTKPTKQPSIETLSAVPPDSAISYTGATEGIVAHAEAVLRENCPAPEIPDTSDLPDLLARTRKAHDTAVEIEGKLTAARATAEATRAELVRAEGDTHPDLSESDALAAIEAAREADDRAALQLRRLTALHEKTNGEAATLTHELLTRAHFAGKCAAVHVAVEAMRTLRGLLHPEFRARSPKAANDIVRPMVQHLAPVSELGTLVRTAGFRSAGSDTSNTQDRTTFLHEAALLVARLCPQS